MTTKKNIAIQILGLIITSVIIALYKNDYKTDSTVYNVAYFIFSVVFVVFPLLNFYIKKLEDLFK